MYDQNCLSFVCIYVGSQDCWVSLCVYIYIYRKKGRMACFGSCVNRQPGSFKSWMARSFLGWVDCILKKCVLFYTSLTGKCGGNTTSNCRHFWRAHKMYAGFGPKSGHERARKQARRRLSEQASTYSKRRKEGGQRMITRFGTVALTEGIRARGGCSSAKVALVPPPVSRPLRQDPV